MNKPSKAYVAAIEASKEIHKGKQFTGKFLRPHAPYIKEIIDRLGCKTILDYGCGKGQQYEWIIPSTGQTIEQYWGVNLTKYDPAWPPFTQEPEGKFDLVICTQVLGAIPHIDRVWFIDRLYDLSEKAIYISERLEQPRKIIGDNALRPQWDASRWRLELRRSSKVEVTLSTREIVNDEKITTHFRNGPWGNGWRQVVWPQGVRAMNHKWVPENA